MEDRNNCYSHFEMRPGTSLTTKLVSSDKTVINTLVHHLLDEYAFLLTK